jgi:hypothetical protein
MNDPDPEFWARIVDDALAALRDECREFKRTGIDGCSLVLTVETTRPLPPFERERLRSDAPRVAGTVLRSARVTVQTISGQHDLSGSNGLVVTVERRDPLGGAPEPAGPEPVAAHQRRLLTLRCGQFSFPQLLVPSMEWLPVRRAAQRYRGSAEIMLPDWLTSVSRDPLFELRLDDDCLMLRRSSRRPETTVLVNDKPCAPPVHKVPVERPVPDHGTITLLGPEGRTDIGYRVEPWVDAPLEPGTGLSEETGAKPYRTGFEADALLGWLDIEPPPVGTRPAHKEFPVHAPALGHGSAPFYSEVLYTRATSQLGPLQDREWHVKIFRTATPQHANLLRDHFQVQAIRVNNLVVEAGGRLLDPPWGIAPVHVIDPRRVSGVTGTPERTGYGPAPAIEQTADGCFGEWFGAPGGAPSTCFVVVASPLLEPAPLVSLATVPLIIALPDFADMARTLDLAHGGDLAYCDIKPGNMCQAEHSYALVDADSVADLNTELSGLSYTWPYARSSLRRAGSKLYNPDLIEHDRFCFALVVLAAVAGTAWVQHVLSGDPDHRIADDRAAVRTAMRRQWASTDDTVDLDPLIEVLTEPFDEEQLHKPDWSCGTWLDRAIAAANTPRRSAVETHRPYSGPYAAAMADLRRAVGDRTPGMPERLPAVHQQIQAQRERLERVARLKWFAWPALAGLLIIIVSVAAIVRSI